MKKLLSILLIISYAMVLASCKVNWFGAQYDVEWYVIALPVTAIFVCGYILLMRTTFICPRCGTHFRPKWYQLQVTIHFNHKRYAKCPACNFKGFCETIFRR